ncbi:Major facilitator-type transporter ecdD [Colletotrichum sp. SAR 10_75]|nr:Major facilitator-type transporter ecdD [Colletotrichum sp. SAR 10_75]
MGRGIFAGKAAFANATPRLMLYCLIYAMGSVFFGYDGASFGGVQAMTPFMNKFGSYSTTKKAYYLPSRTASLMNSLPLLGKFTGTVVVGPIIERIGHRRAMAVTCLVQIVGAISEFAYVLEWWERDADEDEVQVTSNHAAQFVTGRFLVYTAVGLVENVVPTYQSEIAPAPLRGFFVGSIQLCLTFGSLIAGIVNESMSRRTDSSGWQIATAIQALPAVLIMCGLWFTPNSPRWLVFNDRSDEAIAVLRKVRRQEDVDNGRPEMEIAAMRDEGQIGKREKGPWRDLFNEKNRRRTGIACSIMALQQLTGVTFSSSYGPTFYRSVGLADKAFVYAVVNNATSVVTAMMAMVFLDMFGRRTLVFHGGWSQGAFLIAIGALGRKASPNVHESNGIVAGMQLYTCILHMTLGPGAYITAAEVGTQTLREKTMALSTALNVVVGFIVVFVTPYLLAEIGAGLGYIWGGFAFLTSVWAWFCMPELKGRNLEEIDQLFEANIPAWQFHKFQTDGLSHDLAVLEGGKADVKVVEQFEDAERGAPSDVQTRT